MNMRRVVLLFAAVAAVAALVLSASLYLVGSRDGGSGVALIGGPFELVDQSGRTVREQDFRGRLMLVYFGYTYCPDVCPTELQTMSVALDRLGPKAEAVQPVFITVDPERDDVQQMADYVSHFHPSLVGLTGSPEQVAAAAKAYRVYYAKVQDEASSEYLMDHTSFVYLMDREGSYVTHFGPQTPPEEMAARIEEHLS